MAKHIIRHINYLLIILSYYLLLFLFRISCPFLAIFKIPCPGCGSTRALLSLIGGNYKSYIDYNPMAILILITIMIAFHINILSKYLNKKVLNFLIIVFSIIIFSVYVYRVFIV